MTRPSFATIALSSVLAFLFSCGTVDTERQKNAGGGAASSSESAQLAPPDQGSKLDSSAPSTTDGQGNGGSGSNSGEGNSDGGSGGGGASTACECETARSMYIEVEGVLSAAMSAIGSEKSGLTAKYQELDAAQTDLARSGDSFEIQIVARCVVAGFEALTVAKSVTALKTLGGNSLYASQCAVVGASKKDISTYVLTNTEGRRAAVTLGSTTALIASKTVVGGGSGITKYIPIVGGTCGAYDYSGKVFTAPAAIAEIGVQMNIVLRKQAELTRLLGELDAKLVAARNERDAICNAQ